MEGQKWRSQDARLASNRRAGGVRLDLTAEQTSWLEDVGIMATNDVSKYVWDKGRDANVEVVFTSGGFLEEGEVIGEGTTMGLVLNKSLFYAKSAGQNTNLGTISLEGGGDLIADNVQVYSGCVLHLGIISGKFILVGSTFMCRVDYARQRVIAPNHSMTHVLNAAFRVVLGKECNQRGNQCNEEKLRFDFSHISFRV